ncbi:hypothetical protein SIO70_26440 [Chitinophaga sancti]|uniref:hypothetical protein n=1 Tax=Chitinophaga sancti TaxID=1004 RepID=UPI002A762EA3|nr:hypothetical protein [Chitinophaga sancti]WPQ61905.1 hypothetical protein SIO70_26440 [Chitinophaga sancti]
MLLITLYFNMLIPTSCNSQSVNDSIQYSLDNPGVYAFTDRSIYMPGEDINAFIYLMNAYESSVLKYSSVYVCLVDPYTDSAIVKADALLDGTAAQMTIHLPLSIPPADYLLKVVTNEYAEGMKENIFRSLIHIRTTKQPPIHREPIKVYSELLDERRQDTLQWKVPANLHAEVIPVKSIYNTRELAQFKVTLRNAEGKPMEGSFIATCALSSRVFPNEVDICKYYYYNQYLENYLPMNWNMNTATDSIRKLGKDIRLHKFAPRQYSNFYPITGNVRLNGKLPQKPLVITVAENLWSTKTDSRGNFKLPDIAIGHGSSSYVTVVPSEDRRSRYQVTVTDHRDSLYQVIARTKHRFETRSIPDLIPEDEFSNPFSLSFKDTHTTLTEIPIDQIEPYADSGCDATVCRELGVWKCNFPMHHLKTPNIGQTYSDGQSIFNYVGCPEDNLSADWFKKVRAIPSWIEFYSPDFGRETFPAPQKQGTLYFHTGWIWKETGEGKFEFYTNDLKGTFIVLLEGFSNEGPFSAQATITVK